MTTLERMARPDALPVMARVYLVALGLPRLSIDKATLAHMGALYDGAEPVTAADVSALSILRDPLAVLREEQAPPPPCATCGGSTWVGEPGQRVNCPACRPEAPR